MLFSIRLVFDEVKLGDCLLVLALLHNIWPGPAFAPDAHVCFLVQHVLPSHQRQYGNVSVLLFVILAYDPGGHTNSLLDDGTQAHSPPEFVMNSAATV